MRHAWLILALACALVACGPKPDAAGGDKAPPSDAAAPEVADKAEAEVPQPTLATLAGEWEGVLPAALVDEAKKNGVDAPYVTLTISEDGAYSIKTSTADFEGSAKVIEDGERLELSMEKFADQPAPKDDPNSKSVLLIEPDQLKMEAGPGTPEMVFKRK